MIINNTKLKVIEFYNIKKSKNIKIAYLNLFLLGSFHFFQMMGININ